MDDRRNRELNLLRSVTLLACLLLSGCSQPPDSAAPNATAPTSTSSGAPPSSDQPLEIAVVPKGIAFDFWLSVKAGAEAAGKEHGATILWNGPAKETETDKQIAILENFITRKVSAIVMAACDANALVETIEKADRAGIPVVTIDSGVNSTVPKTAVATDNEKAAQLAADALAAQIGDVPAEVGLIPFVQGAATSDQREAGFKAGLAKHPNLKLVATLYSQSQSDQAIRITENMLTAHPRLAGIFAASEPGAIGCAEVLDGKGLAGKVKLVAFDAAPSEIRALEKGTIQALVVQNPFKMGYEGVSAAVRVLRGESVPPKIDTGVAVITKADLGKPETDQLLYPTGKK